MDKKRIHEMLEKMTEWALSEIQSKGKEGVDTKEMGEVIDMVKDLAEAEKAAWEKCYYEKIVEAMKEEEEEAKQMGMTRSGYDRWRTSSGRFAPKGTGHETSMATATGRAGFDPRMPDIAPWYVEPWMSVMGYPTDGRNSTGSSAGRSDGRYDVRNDATGRMGYTPDDSWSSRQTPYEKYKESRRHFHETKAPEHKQEMTDHAKEYVEETIGTMRDIFSESDPQLQQKIKSDLSNLCREFGITK